MSIDRRERREKVSESKRCCSAAARGNYKIAKINHKTWPACLRATIKLVGAYFSCLRPITRPLRTLRTHSRLPFFSSREKTLLSSTTNTNVFGKGKLHDDFANFCKIIVPVPTILPLVSVFPSGVFAFSLFSLESRRIRNPLGALKISNLTPGLSSV